MSEMSLDQNTIETLRGLVDEDDPDFLKDLLHDYVESTAQNLKSLTDAMTTRDNVTVVRAAHTMKGASSNVGAIAMAALCEQAEKLGGDDQLCQMEGLVTSLSTEFQQVKVAISKEVD